MQLLFISAIDGDASCGVAGGCGYNFMLMVWVFTNERKKNVKNKNNKITYHLDEPEDDEDQRQRVWNNNNEK